MGEQTEKSWLRRRMESGLRKGLLHAYETIQVDPSRFLMQLRVAYGLPVTSFQGVYSVSISQLDDIAREVVQSGSKLALAEGAGLGLGGFLTIVPDLSLLACITMRTIQKLSLVYGFEYNTEQETSELWIAAASAAGVDLSRDLFERQVVKRFVPRVIQRIAAKASQEVVEKWAGRMVPLASSVVGAGLNYYFVRAWGERAALHFRQKHLRARDQTEPAGLPAPRTVDAPR